MFDEIAKTFRGERPLVVTYWLWAWLPSVVLFAISYALPPLYVPYIFDYPNLPNIVRYSFLSVQSALFIFIIVSVARSAYNYKGFIIWKVLAVLAVLIGAARVAQSWSGNDSNQPSIETQLQETVRLLNPTLPRQFDPITTLKSISADGLTLKYFFETTRDFTPAQLKILEANLIDGNCANKDQEKLLEKGVQLEYNYARNGQDIAHYTVTKLQCAGRAN